MAVVESFTCIDCGGTCRLLSHPRPDEPWEAGDVVAYRCPECGERFDVVVDEDDID